MTTIPEYGVYHIHLSSGGGKETKLVHKGGALVVDRDALAPSGEDANWDQWVVHPVSATGGVIYTFTIKSIDNKSLLSYNRDEDALELKSKSNTTWNVELVTAGKDKHELRITTDDQWDAFIQVDNEGQPKFVTLSRDQLVPGGDPQYSGWKFQPVRGVNPAGDAVWSATTAPTGKSFQKKFFGLTLEEAAKEKYDIIIVGSGIGGGILANDLYDTNFKLGRDAKRVLLLERGGLVFHSHCLNTARPTGLMNDRGQQNDTFFNQFKEEFNFTTSLDKGWSGGPMYNLGGRSAAWGLFSPRVHDDVLKEHFDDKVAENLKNEYYDKAERLMLVSLPTTRRSHQHIMDRLTSKCQEVEPTTVPWHWGRIASEFKDDRNFDFAEGAYSTIDKIIEFAMSRPEVKVGEKSIPIEHKYFKTVLNAEVRSLKLSGGLGSNVKGVEVKDVERSTREGRDVLKTIQLRDEGKVILCAGSVDSPAILLRSLPNGPDLSEEKYNGLHLTDHTVKFYQCSFRYSDPEKRAEYGAMKLQTYTKLGIYPKPDGSGGYDQRTVLVNMSIDASSFLPRGKAPDPNLPKFIIVFMLQQDLIKGNTIKIQGNTTPVITMGKNPEPAPAPMQQFILATMKALVGSAGLEFVGFEGLGVDPNVNETELQNNIGLGTLPLGGVAHELGTLPMQVKAEKRKGTEPGYCLDTNLAIRDEICKGAYVCDLSVLPHSPEANPTLTLAALAIRLSRHLQPRLTIKEKIGPNVVYAINHSGARVKVFLSKHQSGQRPEAAEREVLLEPGQWNKWTRKAGIPQALLVYHLDRSQATEKFLEKALVLEAHPGRITTILST